MISTAMKVSIVVLVAALAFALSPVAEAREFGAIYKECGLGGMLFPNHSILAIISNITWDWGTTAILSDASSPESCEGGRASTAALIHDAYDSLEKDLARGNGEYLDALVALSGCSVDVSQPLALALRTDFGTAVAVDGYTDQTQYQKAENLYNMFYKQVDGYFTASCNSSS